MKVAVLVHGEEVLEAATGHDFNRLVDGLEFNLNNGVLDVDVVEGGQNFLGFGIAALEHQPARRFGHEGNEDEDDDAKDDLEGQGETPGNGARSETQAKINPVTQHDTGSDERSFDHDHLASFVCL